ncbi:unnamed protein product [Paramecium primaurelia]|uniref:non-specific serine/threonine protein kinase n=1 Tax=Paramecium primaurelia TaxID=5886 RepID=A0A8S1NBQ9_PARPR|nr:unnamed protein product [Paramecium primaurelia]
MIEQFQVQGSKDKYIVYNKVLGKGAYGVVLLAKAVILGSYHAAKIISKKSLSQTDISNLRNEINIQSKLTHPNIVAMVEAFEDNEYLYMLLEYCNGGCLFTNIQLSGPLREDKALQYFVKIVKAVQYLHSKNVLHRDIKLSNLLLTSEDQIKLADFTWSTSLYGGYVSPQICGTLEYMPPEVIGNKVQNEKLDIWSLGIVLYEMLHNDFPKIGQLFFKFGISDECKLLVKQMLENDPNRRPTTAEILISPWVRRFHRYKELSINIIKSSNNLQDQKGINQFSFQTGSPLGSPLRAGLGTPQINGLGSPLRNQLGSSFGFSLNNGLGSPLGSPMQSPMNSPLPNIGKRVATEPTRISVQKLV